MDKNYNDGEWHIWEKAAMPPLHKFTTVDAVVHDPVAGSHFLKEVPFWKIFQRQIQVFRVTEEWIAGTPVWVTLNPVRAVILEDPKDIETYEGFGYIKMQEVP